MKTVTKSNTPYDIMSLSVKMRASLAHALIQSLDTITENNVEQCWDIEVQKRIQKFKNDKSKDHPAFEALDKIKLKYK